jgi:hypothetical protein
MGKTFLYGFSMMVYVRLKGHGIPGQSTLMEESTRYNGAASYGTANEECTAMALLCGCLWSGR